MFLLYNQIHYVSAVISNSTPVVSVIVTTTRDERRSANHTIDENTMPSASFFDDCNETSGQ